MVYNLKATPTKQAGDMIVATALNGVVYTENSRLHVKTNTRHLVYKFDGTPAGWYVRNLKNSDDVYLGKNVSPTIALENLEIKSAVLWNSVYQPPQPPTDDKVKGKTTQTSLSKARYMSVGSN